MAKLRIFGIYLTCLMMVSLTGCGSGAVEEAPDSAPVDVDLTEDMDMPGSENSPPGL